MLVCISPILHFMSLRRRAGSNLLTHSMAPGPRELLPPCGKILTYAMRQTNIIRWTHSHTPRVLIVLNNKFVMER